MAEPAVAHMLLTSAQQDLSAAEVLAQTPGLADAIVGFHAQQAVEKALKAVLSAWGGPLLALNAATDVVRWAGAQIGETTA